MCSSETSVDTQRTTGRYIPEADTHRCSYALHVQTVGIPPSKEFHSDMRGNKYAYCSEECCQSLQGNARLINYTRFLPDFFRRTLNERSTPHSSVHNFTTDIIYIVKLRP
jgi:YHS domain-containing protein